MSNTKSGVMFITGGASGIGAAIAKLAVARGHKVVVTDINGAGAWAVAADLGDAALAVELDIFSAPMWDAALDAAWARFGRVDVLVNNAGIVHPGFSRDVPLELHQQTLNVNFMGPLIGIQKVLPRFKKQGSGHVATVCSMTAFLPFPGIASYAASKHALRAFHHAVALEERNGPIDFTIVHPTSTETPMLEKEAQSDAMALAFAGSSVSAEFVADVVLTAIEKKKVEVFMPPERAALVRRIGTSPRSLLKMVERNEAVGAEKLKARRAAAAS